MRTSSVMTATALAPIDAFLAHDDPVNHVAFAREASLMASADTAMVVKVWRNREQIRELDLRSISDKVRPTERIRGLRFSGDCSRLYVAAGENVLCYGLTSETAEPDWTYVAPRFLAFLIISPTSIAISERDTLAAAFDNGTLAIWDPSGVRRSLLRHNAAPRKIEFLPDDSILGMDSFNLSLWKAEERRPVWIRPSKDRLYSMAATSDGKYVAVRHLFSTHIFEVETGDHVVEHKQGRGLPLLAFGPGTHQLALGTQHAIHVYDVPKSTHVKLALDDAELISLTWLSDGSQVVAGCSDGRIRTWDNPLQRAPWFADSPHRVES